MPLLRQLRGSAAIWAAPIVVVLAYLLVEQEASFMPGSWMEATSEGLQAVLFVAPLCATVAAWEAGRLRRGHVADHTPTRSPVTIMLHTLWPVALLAILGLAGAAVTMGRVMIGVPGWPEWRLVVLGGVVVTALTAVGYLIGGLLRAVYAVPLTLVGTLVWMVYLPSLSSVWWASLDGNLGSGCCMLSYSIDPRAIWGPLIFNVGLLAAVLLFVVRRSRRSIASTYAAPLAAVAVMSIVTVAAHGVMGDVHGDLVVPRTSGQVCQTRAGLTGCAWIEDEAGLSRAIDVAAPAVERLVAIGFPRPTRLVESMHRAPGEWSLNPSPESSEDGIKASLADALYPQPANCDGPNLVSVDADNLSRIALIWLERKAGASREYEEAVRPTRVDERAAAERILTRSEPEQMKWFTSVRAAVTGCGPIPAGLD